MTNWKEYKLEDVATIQTGPFGSQLHQSDYVNNGTPIITVEHLGDNRITCQNLPKVTDWDKERLKKYHLQEGDVVFSRVGSVDRRALVSKQEDGWLFSGRCLRVRADEKLANGAFLSYYFGQENFKEYIRRIAVGATMPSINTKILSEILIRLPNLPTQSAIAEILSSLDDKIELNNKINQELENLAQALFKQWFIDFEFPDENGNPYKSSGGELVDSELGEIPKGWKVLKIGEVLDFVSGYPFKGASFSKDGNYGIVTIKNVQDGLFVEQIDNYIDELPNKFPVNTMLTIGDILMSLTGNVGRVCYVTSDNCLLNQRVVKFKSVQENANAFWYYYFRQNAIKEVLISISKGTAQLNLSPVETKLLQCKLPRIIAPHILSAFDAIFSKQIECSMENKNLSNLRDTLLPKLISGELEINQTLY